jgi:hypothetical protein
MAHASLSTSVDAEVATRLRVLAKREARTSSSMIANALALYTLMPREMRDSLHLFAAEDETLLRTVLNEMAAIAVRHKFEFARRELSKSMPEINGLGAASDTDIAEMAVAMTANP